MHLQGKVNLQPPTQRIRKLSQCRSNKDKKEKNENTDIFMKSDNALFTPIRWLAVVQHIIRPNRGFTINHNFLKDIYMSSAIGPMLKFTGVNNNKAARKQLVTLQL